MTILKIIFTALLMVATAMLAPGWVIVNAVYDGGLSELTFWVGATVVAIFGMVINSWLYGLKLDGRVVTGGFEYGWLTVLAVPISTVAAIFWGQIPGAWWLWIPAIFFTLLAILCIGGTLWFGPHYGWND